MCALHVYVDEVSKQQRKQHANNAKQNGENLFKQTQILTPNFRHRSTPPKKCSPFPIQLVKHVTSSRFLIHSFYQNQCKQGFHLVGVLIVALFTTCTCAVDPFFTNGFVPTMCQRTRNSIFAMSFRKICAWFSLVRNL